MSNLPLTEEERAQIEARIHALEVEHSDLGDVIARIAHDPVQDQLVWTEYLDTVVKERADWKDLYRACRNHS